MMKVLIVSDSHGLTKELAWIKNRHQDVDAMIHCGDSELPKNAEELSGFLTVRGNCDFEKGFPNEIVESIGNTRFLICHGHLYNVKMTLMNVYYRAKEVDANIVCFGHSHVALAERIDNTVFINPGSIRIPRMRKEKTYVILQVKDKEIIVDFYDLDGNIVASLSQRFMIAE
jgi:uncharacterized protein